jgi:hypothetical protein
MSESNTFSNSPGEVDISQFQIAVQQHQIRGYRIRLSEDENPRGLEMWGRSRGNTVANRLSTAKVFKNSQAVIAPEVIRGNPGRVFSTQYRGVPTRWTMKPELCEIRCKVLI